MDRQVSTSEYQELIDAFQIFDLDKSGKISRNEMNQLLKGLELELNDENELEELIKQFDIDGDGYISLIEFLNIMGYSTDNTEFIDHEIVKAFKFFDKDNNGFIDDTELGQAIYRLTKKRMRKQKILDMINSVDKNGDGVVSIEEFKELMKNF